MRDTPERLVAQAEAGRKCIRCHADVHASDGPHLCKDVVGRLHEQERRLKSAIRKVFWEKDREEVAAKLAEAYVETVNQLVDEIYDAVAGLHHD